MKKWLPLIIASVFVAWIIGALRPPSDKPGAFAVQEFGRLPLVSNGRYQPIDSLARNSLLQMREKQTANLEPWKDNSDHPKIISAIDWLMAMMMNQDLADTWPVIRIDHPDVKGLLALPGSADPDKHTDGKHFSWNAIKPKIDVLQKEGRRIAPIDSSKRNPYEQAVLRLSSLVGNYARLQNTLQPHPSVVIALLQNDPSQNAQMFLNLVNETQPEDVVDWRAEFSKFSANRETEFAAYAKAQAKQPFDEAAFLSFKRNLVRFEAMGMEGQSLLIPPTNAGAGGKDEWLRTGDALLSAAQRVDANVPVPAALGYFADMSTAYRADQPAAFNSALTRYRAILSTQFQPELKKAAREQFFNAFEPFYKSMVIYIVAFIGALGFWFSPKRLEWLRRTAVWLVVVALVVHTVGLLFRMTLEGRPPVTNLYSSAIFIGWGACILGLLLERFWRNSIGVVVSSVIGFLTLIIAHHLSLSGDTMEMMRAVLDTNFWLATHVVVVTLGYASTYVAGFLAMIYILRGVFTTSLDAATAKSLGKMVYGIVCFATLFSFVGTVLGGIWADQSWGRFWGWDPKENGALIIVLWNALILHARWGGMVKERGLMNLAIVGNIVTSWSWFGVNMLGIGLHAYGFMDAAFRWLLFFVATQLLFVLIGSLPPRLWRSFSPPPDGPKSGPLQPVEV